MEQGGRLGGNGVRTQSKGRNGSRGQGRCELPFLCFCGLSVLWGTKPLSAGRGVCVCVCVCVCVMWQSFLSLCLPPEGLPPSFEAPVAMTQQESQTCSSAAAEPPITTPLPATPGSLPGFPSLGHPHGGPEARISLTPSQRQGARAQSGQQGGLKAQPPLQRGGMTFPGSEILETGQSQGP